MSEAATTTPQAMAAAGLMATVRSEWTKLFTVRSTYITLALGIVLSIGMTALVSLATGTTFDDWNARDQADFEPTMFSLVGIVFGGIVFSVMGVLAVTGEYSSGMIRLTLIATPRRWRVLAAKAIVVAVVLTVVSTVTTVGMFLTGQAILASFDMPTVGLGEADALRAVAAMGLLGAFFPLIGLSLGFLLRSAAGGITAVLAILWLPEIFGGLLPMWWRENILSLLPGPALDSVAIGHIVDSPMYSHAAVGGVVAAIWLVIFLGAAQVMLSRRDA